MSLGITRMRNPATKVLLIIEKQCILPHLLYIISGMRLLKAIYSAIYTVLGIACHLERLHGISPINFFVANFTWISQEKKKSYEVLVTLWFSVWTSQGLNLGPPDYESVALTNWATSPGFGLQSYGKNIKYPNFFEEITKIMQKLSTFVPWWKYVTV